VQVRLLTRGRPVAQFPSQGQQGVQFRLAYGCIHHAAWPQHHHLQQGLQFARQVAQRLRCLARQRQGARVGGGQGYCS
jgi:hypothetical protein